jgi:GDP-mannose 6-dehydrogenase
MKISVFGLGYVGCVTGACLAQLGYEVTGVDINERKIEMINKGVSPIIEKDIDQIIKSMIDKKRFTATSSTAEAIERTDAAIICVGTPSKENGSLDLSYILKVIEQIGQSLENKNEYFVVIMRSTIFPGTIQKFVIPVLEKNSKKRIGKDIGICMYPEFMREGSSVQDFYHPPKNVIGEYDRRSGDTVDEIFKKIEAPSFRTSIKAAEMIKYCDNGFHALKVTFANEIGNVCKELGIDSHEVMNIFCADTKLNLSPYYLKPGFAFGGSCLPKDLRAFIYEAKHLDVEIPVLSNIPVSNRKQIDKIVNKLLTYKGKRIGFLGLSFKGGTDDLRESPLVAVVETIIGKGCAVIIYDKYVSISNLFGANKDYIKKEIPHIASLMVTDPEELINNSDVIVIGNKIDEYRALVKNVKQGKSIIDLVRIVDDWKELDSEYYGICW